MAENPTSGRGDQDDLGASSRTDDSGSPHRPRYPTGGGAQEQIIVVTRRSKLESLSSTT